ncbi:MAG TPA: endolytic transglycosylase MltG, partial [Prolixibacteraceae bacterium]|nr:endolytic transglycosylase MltG [Prolixibacteraceae bacterium]
LANPKAFHWISKKKKYTGNVRPGRFKIPKGWNTNQLVNKLRSGEQDPLMLIFNNIDSFDELAGKTARYLESDSVTLAQAFLNRALMMELGFRPETYPAMFIPNTYEVYWTTSPENFIRRMHEEYQRFWNAERKAKAEAQGLNPVEAATLASIVQKETAKSDEMPRVAGVYLNRLKRSMPLQADPTVKFALADTSIRRITKDMLNIDSPYNTYRIKGLPPGPVCFPEISALEAVLNAEKHEYLYMCAKEDFSGYHRFASNLVQHNRNAARYQKALNDRKIWR